MSLCVCTATWMSTIWSVRPLWSLSCSNLPLNTFLESAVFYCKITDIACLLVSTVVCTKEISLIRSHCIKVACRFISVILSVSHIWLLICLMGLSVQTIGIFGRVMPLAFRTQIFLLKAQFLSFLHKFWEINIWKENYCE